MTGLDVALDELPFGRARIGLLTHRAAVTADGRPGRSALLASGARVVRLFSPEHGLDVEVAAGVRVAGGEDVLTGLPVTSLYGERREPSPESLAGLDALVVDLQDVGARCYTYLSTMVLTMRAAAGAGLPVWVLDRPNPIGGRLVEGIVRRPGFGSFVGQLAIPMRHGLTFAELARWARPGDLDLHVVPMRGWRRDMWWDETGHRWPVPSPAIPDLEVALAYPGTVLLEGTAWSEGRETARPFILLAGPSDSIRVEWQDRERFRPVAEGMRILQRLCLRDGPRWKDGGRMLDLLFGSDELRLTLESGRPVEPLIAAARREGEEFAAGTSSVRLYR